LTGALPVNSTRRFAIAPAFGDGRPMPTIEVNGTSVHYVDEGPRDAPALLFSPSMLSRTPEYADAAWHIAHRPSILDELKDIKIPLTVVAGTEDHTYPPPKSEQIVAGVPHAKLVVMERTGHVHALENPEAVNAVLEEHLAALGAATAPPAPA
jgi:pimeloyl-ACP methyl ester carboxylesterase